MHEETALPPAAQRLIDRLARLPGIGRKSALRLAMHLIHRPPEEIGLLIETLESARDTLGACGICGNLTDEQPCRLCRDPARADGILCIVEEPMDLLGIERSGAFRGRYHVLGGALSPLAGIGPDRLRIGALIERVRDSEGRVKEIICATNPTPEGDATAAYLHDRLAPMGVSITRIAYGLPQGGDLEYLDGLTIRRALENRRPA